MSRSTQYVGLNKYALDFVKDAIKVEEYEMTIGMFEEPVMGKIYYMKPDDTNVEITYKEVVQVMPWSGGPMIFTCLKQTLVKKYGQILEDGENFFQWMIDPSLKDEEYCIKTGRYYI